MLFGRVSALASYCIMCVGAYNIGMVMPTVNTESLLTPTEAADMLDLSERRVQRLCQEGRLGIMVGGRYLIPKQQVERFRKIPRRAGRPPSKR